MTETEPSAVGPDLAARLAQRESERDGMPVMYQRWSELLFLHWTCDPDEIQQSLPDGLTIDTHQDRAWIGLVPFRMSGIRPRGFPALPWLSAFPEMNVRTYVFDESGRPGVWFYSLDAARWAAVKFARQAFRLPYFHADMKVNRDSDSGWIDYRSRRFDGCAEAQFRYRGVGEARVAEPGGLDFFLLERYLLYAPGREPGKFHGGYVSHAPYRFQTAEAPIFETSPISAAGLPPVTGPPDHVAYVDAIDVSVFGLEG